MRRIFRWSRHSALLVMPVALVLALLSVVGALPSAATAPPATRLPAAAKGLTPTVRAAVDRDLSPTLRTVAKTHAKTYAAELRKADTAPTREAKSARTLPKAAAATAPKAGGSALVQRGTGKRVLAAMPDTIASFEGLENLDQVYPPDPNGDVGGTYYVQWVNVHLQVFDKNTGASLLGPLPGNALWSGFGGVCETSNDGDPIVQYDHLANRWMMSQFAIAGSAGNHQCIAVSQTGDPTGAYYRYDFLISQTLMNDYPKFGVWPDGYYMSINQFNASSGAWKGAGAVAFERSAMLTGAPARMVYFDLGPVSPDFGGQLPSDLDGAAPPDGAPNIFAEADDDAFGFPTDRINAWKFHVDWANPASSTFGTNGQPSFSLDTAPFDSNMCGYARGCIPQQGTTVKLDAISDRLMYRLQYRNFGDHQSIVANHTVDADGSDHAGLRWYELRSTNGGTTWAVNQQGTYAPDASHRWMGSAAMDVSGNIAVGYSASSATAYPSIRVAGRLAGDPAGQLAQDESTIHAGTGAQTGTASRWGDYTAMQVDPGDQCTFYYTNEYVKTTGNVSWRTRIASFRFPNCTAGPSGTLTGTVTDSASGAPIAGATVAAAATSARTNAAGTYSLTLPVGSYDVTATAYGYQPASATNVAITAGATTTRSFALVPQPKVTLSGTVRDGSGHGWPLYARISVQDTPYQKVYTNPNTGAYVVSLPANTTYTLHVKAMYPGYQEVTKDVAVGATRTTQHIRVPVDSTTCDAPGYGFGYRGLRESFDAGTLPTGWGNVDDAGSGLVWQFTDPGKRGNLTGGSGPFAILDSDNYGRDTSEDASLVTPALDLSGETNPVVEFRQDFNNVGSSDVADVDVSIDGGTTWVTVLHQSTDVRGPRTTTVPLPSAAGKSGVKVRFHYRGSWAWWWQVDDVLVGAKTCSPVDGGLVNGVVSDKNTGSGINDALVTSIDKPDEKARTAPTPDDPNLPDGYYWLFSSLTGLTDFRVTAPKYEPETTSDVVAPDTVSRNDVVLRAGRLTVTPAALSAAVMLGGKAARTFTVTNDGSANAHVKVSEAPGSFVIQGADGAPTYSTDILGAKGAPLRQVSGTFSPLRFRPTANEGESESREFAFEPWLETAKLPTSMMDNAVGFIDGKVYSVGGTDGDSILASGYVYDPTTLAWSPIASMPTALEKPNAAVIDGKLYVAGGWTASGPVSAATYVYDPAANTWSTASGKMVVPLAAGATSVTGGRMYVFGGCNASACGSTTSQVYDPATDEWSAIADYPESTSWASCGGIGATVYCAGGTDSTTTSKHTYAYSPASDAYTRKADLPVDLWASGYTAANGLLLVSGGVTNGVNTLTNQGYAYDPGADSWSTIPNAPAPLYRGGSSCGFFRIGGSTGGFNAVKESFLLPGQDQCTVAPDVTWLSERPVEFDLKPGASQVVTVGMDSSKVTQPGAYTASLRITHSTPYAVAPVKVTMVVRPPKTWGKVMGTVTGVACDRTSAPLNKATVSLVGAHSDNTLITGRDGTFAIWVDAGLGNLTVIAAKDGYSPRSRVVTPKAGATSTANFALPKVGC